MPGAPARGNRKMDPEQWQRVERLYHAALGREEGQRAGFLKEACAGDEALHREVESLLSYQKQAGGFIEASALEALARKKMGKPQSPRADDAGRTLVGRTIAHYRVLEKIGAGGMGEVYRARDEELERDVAIKVLPESALADKSNRKRLRKEAEALSKLGHPNIEILFELNSEDNLEFLVVPCPKRRSRASAYNWQTVWQPRTPKGLFIATSSLETCVSPPTGDSRSSTSELPSY
jgi:hypothetical protein